MPKALGSGESSSEISLVSWPWEGFKKKKKWLIWKQINLGPAIGLRKQNGTWNLEFQMEAGMSLKISVQIENSTSNLKVCIKKNKPPK